MAKAYFERGNENWKALEAMVERVGFGNVMVVLDCIARDRGVNGDAYTVINDAKHKIGKHCPHRAGQHR